MADADATFEIDLCGALDALQQARQKYDDLTPLMRSLSEIVVSGVEENIQNEEGPDGPWAELAESTIEDRRRKGYWPGPILQRSGLLAGSIQAFHTEDTAGASTNRRYAALQHAGGTPDMPPGPADVPPRPFMYISEETEKEMGEEVEDYNEEAWG